MNTFDTELKKYTDTVRLKASERRELRERLCSYMEYHPIQKGEGAVSVRMSENIISEPFAILHFNRFYLRIAGSVCALLLIAVPFVAEKSVPGDVLYLVKTGVTETVQAQLVSTPYEKIEFETKLMERRITEARVLASEGKLTEDVKQEITETVKEHTTAVQEGLAELRTHDAEGAAIAQISFNSSLEVQSAVLGADENIEDTALVDSILTVVNDAREEVVQHQNENVPSYESLMAQVERETTRAYELFTTIKESATTEEITDIERRLSDINRLVEEAKQDHDAHPEDITNDLTATIGLTQKLIAFMSNIDVRETVALSELLPVILSDTERMDVVKSEIEVLNGLRTEVQERLTVMQDSGVVEKVQESMVRIDELLLQGTVSLETGDIAHAESVIAEARALMTDIDTLTQNAEVVIPEEGTETPETPDAPVENEVVEATTTIDIEPE